MEGKENRRTKASEGHRLPGVPMERREKAAPPPVVALDGIRRRLPWLRLAAAILSGLLLAAAFPPLGWWPMALLATLPLMLCPAPRRWRGRLLVGFLFGYAHFAAALHWLNSVGFGAGWLLAIYCALYPMLWYALSSALLWHWKPTEHQVDDGEDIKTKRLDEAISHLPGAATAYLPAGKAIALSFVSAALWTLLEWLRRWLFTGFPWDQVGIAFANSTLLRQAAALGGVWLLSFLAIAFAALLADTLLRMAMPTELSTKLTKRRGMGAAMACLLLAAWVFLGGGMRPTGHFFTTPETHPATMNVLAVQGDIPECRSWNESDYASYFEKMVAVTCSGIDAAWQGGHGIQYILWPEGAMPPELTWPRYAHDLKLMLDEVKLPLLLGALDVRYDVERIQEPPEIYNSAILLEATSPVLASSLADRGQHYDKCHLVPFGEYVPFSDTFPKLATWLGLGRDLTPGAGPSLFRLQDDEGRAHLAGVNICFEDAFPAISRRFACRGAEMLMTITNDCWYGHSAGARQHLAHAVMRAVENHRRLLRSGNNSDTCLVQPDGTIVNPVNNGDFGPGWMLYSLPMPAEPDRALTPFARWGDWCPLACAIAVAIAFKLYLRDALARRAWLRRIRRQQGASAADD